MCLFGFVHCGRELVTDGFSEKRGTTATADRNGSAIGESARIEEGIRHGQEEGVRLCYRFGQVKIPHSLIESHTGFASDTTNSFSLIRIYAIS